MKYGLSEAQFQQIVDFIAAYPEVEEAILFGSRAINTFKEASDVDIAIKGNNVTVALAQRMQFDIEEDSYLPFFFDVIAYPSIDNDALIQHIAHKGVVIYKRGVSAWRECKLSEITEPVKNTYLPINTEEFTYIGLEHIEQQSLRLNGVGKSSGVTSNKFLFQKNDVLFGKLRPYFRKVFKPKFSGICSTDIWVFRAKSGFSQDFIFYFMANRDFIDTANSGEGGTRMPRADWNFLKSTLWAVPPLSEQKAIAAVLSSLDDKIDLLHRQNKTLEAMAETLFKQWFVVEAKEDWKKGKLGDEFYFTMGQSPSSNSFNEEKIGVPMFQGNADFGFRFPSERVFTTEPTRFAGKFDTLISVRAPVGAQNMAHKECCIGRGVAAFRYKHNNDYYTYAYFKLRSLMEEIKQFNNEGTVFGSISKFDFENIAITIPSNEIIINFEKEVKPMNDKIIKNCYQIQTLETLRDTLLPKLMSGEIRVNPL